MSEAWNEGYFTDVGYTYGYYREISPVYQRFCLLLRGFAVSDATQGAHCELGFGQGVSINLHAAATPGQFAGTDFNPAHAAHANTLVEASGSGARLFDDSFEQLLNRTDLPQFDSISLHGIWSWVSRENQHIIVEFARRHLKPGGVFYVSYNCFPGWAPASPLRQLFALHDRFSPKGSAAVGRVEAALDFAGKLLDAKPNYLKAVPHLNDRLKQIGTMNRQYLAHEYFNREWKCAYFTDVVDDLAAAKLDYAGTAVTLDVVDALNLTQEAASFLSGIEHPILREQVRDYFVNQQFRKDLYLRGAVRLSLPEQQARLLDSRVVLIRAPETIQLKTTGPAGEANLQEGVYRPLIAALASEDYRPKTLRQLQQACPDMPFPGLVQAVAVLVGLGAVGPCQSEAAQAEVAERCRRLNAHLCERARFGSEVETLASPALGGGIGVNRFQQLFLLAQRQGQDDPKAWARTVWQLLSSQGKKLLKEGKTLESAEENLAELERQAIEYRDKVQPLLKALGVL